MKNIIFRSFCILGVLLLLLSTHKGNAITFDNIIAFGDSLTDVGNVAGLTEPGYSPVIQGYYDENHFSDNLIWVETLGNYWKLPERIPGRGSSTTLPPLSNGNTWAWGGSEAASGSVQPTGVTEPIPNLITEVEQYLAVNNPEHRILYSIWSGADNLLVGGKFGPRAAKEAVAAIETSMRMLERAGARYFLVFNMPKLSDTPSAQAGGRIDKITADIYTRAFNKALRQTVENLRDEYSFRAKIYFVDIYAEIVHVVDTVNHGNTYKPDFFVPGLPVAISNVTGEALTYYQANGTFPTNYLFWDDVHPTTQGHQVIAGLVIRSVKRG